MSDDEYYADSPYDEFEEMLWDADPAPNLADDLAQHAAYSPVWQDDPVGELEQYHSDWEYYSDDYFDDDPAILQNNPVDGTPLRKKNVGQPQIKRGRKRKLGEVYQITDSAENRYLRDTIQGTVWAKDTSSSVKIFQDGQQDKVALLTDWKERFQFKGDKSRRIAKAQFKEDESWANDLSLKDMGLTTVQEPKGAGHAEPDDEGLDSNEDGIEDDQDQEDETFLTEEELTIPKEDNGAPTSDETRPHRGQPFLIPSQTMPRHEDILDIATPDDTGVERGPIIRKRRKISTLSSPPHSHESRTKSAATASTDTAQVDRNSAKSISSKRERSSRTPERSSSRSSTTTSKQGTTGERSKKRKLSCTEDDTSGTSASIASTRNKRVVLTKSKDSQSSTSKDLPTPDVRSTRSRRK